MKPFTKLALVILGYAAAFGAAMLAEHLYELRVNQPGVDTSGGMYAFGSSMQFVAVLGIASLVPTGLALYFIRGSEAAWRLLSRLALAVAVTAPMFGVFFLATRNLKGYHPELGIFALVGFFRLAGTPLFALVFAVAGAMAVGRGARRLLWLAAGIEGAVAVGAVVVWAGRF